MQIRPDDPRNDYQKLSRGQLKRCLDAAGIELKGSMSLKDGMKQLESMGFNVRDVIKFEPVTVKTPEGGEVVRMYPEDSEPVYSEEYENRRNHELAKRLEEAAKKEETSKEEITDLKQQLARMMESQKQMTQLMESMRMELQNKAAEEKIKEPDPRKMKFMAFKKWCKERGYELKKGEKREEVISYLSVQDAVEKAHAAGKIDGEDVT